MKNIDLFALAALAAAGYWVLKNEGVITGQYPESPYPRPGRDLRIAGTSYTSTYPRPGRDLRIADDLNYPYVSVDPRRATSLKSPVPSLMARDPHPLPTDSGPHRWRLSRLKPPGPQAPTSGRKTWTLSRPITAPAGS